MGQNVLTSSCKVNQRTPLVGGGCGVRCGHGCGGGECGGSGGGGDGIQAGHGMAVQVEPMTPMLKAPGTKRLKP